MENIDIRHFIRAVTITDNICTKQGNSSKKSAVYNQELFQIKSRVKWRAYGKDVHG